MASERPSNDLFWLLIILLGIVHWYLRDVPLRYFGSSGTGDEAKHDSEPIEIEKYIDSKKPVVKSSKAPEDPEAKDREARFAGEFRNRVKKETQAQHKGRFQEGGNGGAGRQQGNGGGAGQKSNSTEGQYSPAPGMADLLPFGSSPNEVGDDVEKGNNTVLNTDPVKYASFVNRIADEIYDPWVRFAQEAVRTLYNNGRKLESNVYVTKLQVVMNEQGAITAITTVQSSGIAALDDAPKHAFWSIEPFRNPPKQMFKDGIVKFVYEFHFEWRTSSFNILPEQI